MKPHAIILLAAVAMPTACQETRGMIFGRVLDPQSSAVAGAPVAVTNRDTNTVTHLTTNETGYYEASRLLPGSYEIAAEAPGFKKSIRGGIVLPVGSRLEIDLRLEVGAISESVSVTAEAPMLDTSNVSSGRIISNRTLMDIPVVANNVINFARLTTGMQTSGVNPSYAMLGSVSAASDYYLPGRVGGSEYSIDGAPNNGSGR